MKYLKNCVRYFEKITCLRTKKKNPTTISVSKWMKSFTKKICFAVSDKALERDRIPLLPIYTNKHELLMILNKSGLGIWSRTDQIIAAISLQLHSKVKKSLLRY